MSTIMANKYNVPNLNKLKWVQKMFITWATRFRFVVAFHLTSCLTDNFFFFIFKSILLQLSRLTIICSCVLFYFVSLLLFVECDVKCRNYSGLLITIWMVTALVHARVLCAKYVREKCYWIDTCLFCLTLFC